MANVEPKACCDFETRSAVSLKRCGTWRYSIHPSTEILCLVFRLPFWEPGRTSVWHPAMPALGLEERAEPEAIEEFFDWIADGGLVECFNAFFEFCIWNNVLVPRHGWPVIPLEQYRCAAAKAAAHALPRALDDAAAALKLVLKKDTAKTETEGVKVLKAIHIVRKVSRPRKSRKAERTLWAKTGQTPPQYLWHESVDLLDKLIAYCRVDVLAEEALSHVLDDLSPAETQMFLMDLRINARGFQLDKRAVQVALRLIHQEAVVLNQELTLLTDRVVRRATQRDQMLAWLMAMGLELPNTQKGTIDELLKTGVLQADAGEDEEPPAPVRLDDLDPKVRRALEIMRALGRSSTAKYRCMRDWMARNGRVHGGLLYHGASTGRFSGKGVQPHNFPRPTLKADINELWSVLRRGDRQEIIDRYGDVMEALSSALRGAITAAAGLTLYVADYATIEVRVCFWLAGQQDALDMLRRGEDIYCAAASDVYGYPVIADPKNQPPERKLGKEEILGCQFGMSGPKFQTTCEKKGLVISEELAIKTVAAYRVKYHKIPQLWKDVEAAAIKAVQTGKRVFVSKLIWFTEGRFLFCQLPSGRRLAYPYPEAQMTEMRWGGQRMALSFMGVDNYTRKWKRQTTYGGSLVENCLAGETEVLTPSGWIPLQTLQPTDRVWDGVDWVVHGGLVDNGVQHVVSCDGVRMTADHQVHTKSGWRYASSCDRHLRSDVWLPHGHDLRGQQRQEVPVECDLRVWHVEGDGSIGASQRPCAFLRLQVEGDGREGQPHARHDETPCIRGLAEYVRPLSAAYASGVAQLRGAWNLSASRVGRWLSGVLGRHGADIRARADAGAAGQRAGVLPRELLLGNTQSPGPEQAKHRSGQRNVSRRICRQHRRITLDRVLPTRTRVFDIRNCGPRNQFVVRNADRTRALIVHNCTQAVARDIMAEAMQRVEATPNYQVVLSVHDEIISEGAPGNGSIREYEALLVQCPDWAKGCPIGAEGNVAFRYSK